MSKGKVHQLSVPRAEIDVDEFIEALQLTIIDFYERAKIPYLRQPEFEHLDYVLAYGMNKHGALNYMDADGAKSSFRSMHESMFRHLTESMSGIRADHESGMDPLLHLATRALMLYTRLQRGIVHVDDTEEDSDNYCEYEDYE